MKPILLKLKGVGPYKDEQIIDFKKLSGNQLFLISGETGSGKTYILDAMVEALYGESTSNYRDDLLGMRSQYLEDKDETSIEFVFELKGKTYKFTRKLRIVNKRDKTVGYEPECDALYEDVDGKFISFFENPKKEAVRAKAEELIGLNADQFKQVIILPQGKFEGFLVAKTDKKQEILSTLFGTKKWETFVFKLKEIVSKKRQELDKLKEEINKRNFAVSLGENKTLSEYISNIKKELKEKEEAFDKVKKELEDLEKELKEKENLNNLNKELKEKEEKYQKVISCKDKVKEFEENLQNINKVSTLKPLKDKSDKAFSEYNILLKRIDEIKQEYNKNIDEQKDLENKLKNLEKQDLDIKDKENSLESKKEKLNALNASSDKKNDIEKLTKEKEEREKKISCLEKEIEKLDLNKKQIESEKEDAIKNGLDKIKESNEQLSAFNKAKEFNSRIVEMEASKKQYLQEIIDNEDKKKNLCNYGEDGELYNNLLGLFETAILNEKSKNLKDGDKCPICSNITHIKTFKGDSNIDKASKDFIEYIKNKDSKLLEIENEKKMLESKIMDLDRDIKKVHKDILDTISKEYDEKEHASVEQCHDVIQAKVDSMQKIESRLASIQKDIETKEKEKITLNNSLIQIMTSLDNIKKDLKDVDITKIDKEIDDLKEDITKLEEEISKYNKTINSIKSELSRLDGVISSSEKNQQDLDKDEKRLSKENKDFKDEYIKKLQELKMDEEKIEDILKKVSHKETYEKEIKRYNTEKNSLESRIEEIEKELKDKDLSNLLEKVNKLTEEKKEKDETKLNLKGRIDVLTEEKEKVEKLEKEIKDLEKENKKKNEDYLMTSNFCRNIDGQKGISLHNYILGKLLENIAIEANQLLSKVDNGRYELVVLQEKANNKDKKFGLDLFVIDHNSDKTRSVQTLSGGEKFLVSLSLCLGLSTVVSSFNGGIRMDTIFIDEGFGSLSDSALQDALKILSTMVASRSLVGIISHVDKLKENIRAKLLVEKTLNGSSIKMEI